MTGNDYAGFGSAPQEALRALIGPCRACGDRGANEHFIWLLGVSSLGPQVGETGESLEQLVAERRWAEASKVRRFEGSEDAIEFRILKCGQDGSLMLLKIFYAAELMSMDRLVDASRIPSPDAEILNGIAGMNWERF